VALTSYNTPAMYHLRTLMDWLSAAGGGVDGGAGAGAGGMPPILAAQCICNRRGTPTNRAMAMHIRASLPPALRQLQQTFVRLRDAAVDPVWLAAVGVAPPGGVAPVATAPPGWLELLKSVSLLMTVFRSSSSSAVAGGGRDGRGKAGPALSGTHGMTQLVIGRLVARLLPPVEAHDRLHRSAIAWRLLSAVRAKAGGSDVPANATIPLPDLFRPTNLDSIRSGLVQARLATSREAPAADTDALSGRGGATTAAAPLMRETSDISLIAARSHRPRLSMLPPDAAPSPVVEAPSRSATVERLPQMGIVLEPAAPASFTSLGGGGGGGGGDRELEVPLGAEVGTVAGEWGSKEAAFLRCVEDMARAIRAGRITSCKSAKDRTGMSVTLEEARLLSHFESAVITGVGTAVRMASEAMQGGGGVGSGVAASGLLDFSGNNGSGLGGGAAAGVRAFVDDNVGQPQATTSLQALARVMREEAQAVLNPALGFQPLDVAVPPTMAVLPWVQGPVRNVQAHWRQCHARLCADVWAAADKPFTSLPFTAEMSLITSGLEPTRNPAFAHLFRQAAAFFLNIAVPVASESFGVPPHLAGAVWAGPIVLPHPTSPSPGGDRSIRLSLASRFNVSLELAEEAVGADVVAMANFMREWGSRLANAEKNTGAARFAFNQLQLLFFPLEYRCPTSVLGAAET